MATGDVSAGLTAFPKSDMYLPLFAGAIIWLIAMFAYRYLLRAVPRGGVSRSR